MSKMQTYHSNSPNQFVMRRKLFNVVKFTNMMHLFFAFLSFLSLAKVAKCALFGVYLCISRTVNNIILTSPRPKFIHFMNDFFFLSLNKIKRRSKVRMSCAPSTAFCMELNVQELALFSNLKSI